MVVLLGSTLASVSAAPTPATVTYTLTGYVDQPGTGTAQPVPAGVTVELVSAATGTTYKTTTGTGGVFTFTASNTGSSLAPGYWKLVVPVETNVSVTKCGKCAILPLHQNPTFAFLSYANLTSKTFAKLIPDVLVVPYNATQNGTVTQGGAIVPGVTVDLLDPMFNGVVLSNTTTNASGEYSMSVPYGTWVLQSVHVSGADTFTNSTSVKIASVKPPLLNPKLYSLVVSGWINTTAGRIPGEGNATLYDPSNGYIYSTPTPAGGYYSLPTYLHNFGHTAQTFDLIAAANGYETAWYPLPVSSASTRLTHNFVVKAMPESSMGVYTTTLNFGGINPATGTGTLAVTTDAQLGNDTVVPYLPNATVGQLWAQLGLDYNHTLTFPSTDAAKFEAFLADRGPFFLATQAATTINTTAFTALKGAQTLASFTSGCAAYCGLTSSASIGYSWSQTYTLNGTLAKNSKTYTLGFTFQHPASSSLVYNYSVELPTGYVLAADVTKPARTTFTPTGPDGTWGSFVLTSESSTTASATTSLQIVQAASVKPVVNVTSSNFTFSSANVLNDSEGNYTVVLGLHENATFSAANSVYQSSTNGSSFYWTFGDHTPGVNVTNGSATTNHTYLTSTPGVTPTPFKGHLTITTSSGKTNSTTFFVYVLTGTQSVPKAVISDNVSALDTFVTPHGNRYVEVNWSTTIGFNAANSTVPSPNVKSIAAFSLIGAKTVKKTANYTASSGANVSSNFTVDFSPPKTIGTGPYLTSADVNGTIIPWKGWEYNLTLTVWSATEGKATTTLAILLNDTEKPTPSFTILNGLGKALTTSTITESSKGKAKIELDASATVDPNNGTIATYQWNITNGNNSTLKQSHVQSTVKPYPTFELLPALTPYTINLTVTSGSGITANKTMNLTVSINSTTRPVMTAKTLTGPTSLTAGKSSTFWVNITDTGGKASTADNVTVNWYYQSSSGTGAKHYLSGSPDATVFYGYTSGTVNSAPSYTKLIPSLAFNKTMRAQITWTPGTTGNFVLYANVTATNEFVPDYKGGSSLAAISIAVHPNPTTELIEYGGIAAAVIVAIALLIWWTRRPSRKGGRGGTTGRSGLERGSKKPDSDDKTDSS